MGRKSPYPDEFRKDAVALYRVAGGKRTYAAVAADLGITAESLRTWVRKEDEFQALPERREGAVTLMLVAWSRVCRGVVGPGFGSWVRPWWAG